ncbi:MULTISPECIES: hypothetical protein [unclassified Sinorhizobium]|uniref:hypothetical protein n=1 Tax=unclassified Sinorhizobium TaxID=2613772 RepID=UPI003524937A
MSRPIVTRLRRLLNPRPGYPGRETGRMARASDIVLVMMIVLLVAHAVFRILHG